MPFLVDQGRHGRLRQPNICKQASGRISADPGSRSICRGQMRICGFPPWLPSPAFHSFYSETELKCFQQGPWWTPRSQQGLPKEVKAGEGGQGEGERPNSTTLNPFSLTRGLTTGGPAPGKSEPGTEPPSGCPGQACMSSCSPPKVELIFSVSELREVLTDLVPLVAAAGNLSCVT